MGQPDDSGHKMKWRIAHLYRPSAAQQSPYVGNTSSYLTFDDVLLQLENAKVFSKLDVKEAYWHVRLDEESSQLTTMITPFGYRMRWMRLPFSLKVVSEIL